MKLMFASDIHGSAYWCERLMERLDAEKPDRLVLLGDLLYHGPRNDLPRDYAPKKVIAMLNERKDMITAVRGNCDAEVDQMVLNFPIMADYVEILGKRRIFCTHGHVYGVNNPPLLTKGDVLIHGHTHIYTIEEKENFTYVNIGSVSLPKQNNVQTYCIYEDDKFTIKDLDGNVMLSE